VQGRAEYLLFPNQSFDAVMGVMTIHYWSDVTKGLMELKRVAKKYCFVDDARPKSPRISA
jgi:ubiquinone/menaquinone biosynthesis C-methylase UbiE